MIFGVFGYENVVEAKNDLSHQLTLNPSLIKHKLIFQSKNKNNVHDGFPSFVQGFNCVVEIQSDAGWRELVRNVPKASKEQKINLVCVVKDKNNVRGPILVLCGLKYSGNVGTIIRSSVQANVFEAIYIINERGTRKEDGPNLTKEWGNDGKKISDKDLNYYSMYNAPLIDIERFEYVDDFMTKVQNDDIEKQQQQQQQERRNMISLDLNENSINLYSTEALNIFKNVGKDMYLVIGAEDTGTPQRIVAKCDYSLEIPSLSASINVTCAFMACLSIYMYSLN